MHLNKIPFLTLLAFISTQLNAQLCFGPPTNFTTGSQPSAITSADFNGDGIPDLATANGNVSVLLGSGTGSFGAPANFSIGQGQTAFSIISADFNGDGKADLAMAGGYSNNVFVLLGTGTGSFGMVTNFLAGSIPYSVISADFNGDGKTDLATANSNSTDVSILLGRGTGSFGAATNFSVGYFPHSIISADFNGDGKADLATNNISILLGTGTGSFGAATNFQGAQGLVISDDFNGDGKADLALANLNAVSPTNFSHISILLGTGTGSFGAATSFPVERQPQSIISADFNGDGIADLATNGFINDVCVLLGTGGGNFAAAAIFSIVSYPRPLSITSADFNRDGKADLATANSDSLNSRPNNVSILLNCVMVDVPNYSHEKEINIYPNPASEEFFIEGISVGKYFIDIFDIGGRLLLSESFDSPEKCKLKGISEGIYNLCIKTNTGVINKKLVVMK